MNTLFICSFSGLVLAVIKDVANVSITVKIKRPTSLHNVIPDLFNVTTSGSLYSLVVTQSVDLEALYEKAVSHINKELSI